MTQASEGASSVRMCIKMRGRVGTHAPKERRKKDCEKGDGVCKMIFPSPQAIKPLAEFHSKNIDFPL